MQCRAMPLYSGTKFALRGYANAIRYELEPDQYVQLVYPIATLTEFFSVAQSGHLPWPRQKASTIARAIIQGIERKKNHIYPSAIYHFMQGLSRIIPIIPLYMQIEGLKFQKEYNIRQARDD